MHSSGISAAAVVGVGSCSSSGPDVYPAAADGSTRCNPEAKRRAGSGADEVQGTASLAVLQVAAAAKRGAIQVNAL